MKPEIKAEQKREMTEKAKKAVLSRICKTTVRIVGIVVHNWPWKLLSLLLALCLWAGLITQDTSLTRERIFTDVPVTVSGADTLRRNGLIVLSGLDDAHLNVRLRVDVPQREYNTVTPTYYNPRIDLTRITKPGEQDVKITTTSTIAYGSVEDVTPSSLSVVVDKYVTNYRVPVSVNVVGEYPENFYGGTISRDPSLVALSGPESLVDQVARIVVDYDLSLLEAEAGTVAVALPMRFMDREGNEIVSDLLEATASGVVLRTISLSQALYPIRELAISENDLISGTPAKGYQVTKVEITPKTLRAAGDEDVLDDLNSLFVENTANVEGVNDSFTAALRIRKPSELAYLNSSTVNVSVTIEPVIVSRSFSSVKLNVRGNGSGLKASTDIKNLSVVLSGPQLLMDSIRPSEVSAYVDVSGLEEGEYILPVQFHVEDADMQAFAFESTPSTVTVTIFK